MAKHLSPSEIRLAISFIYGFDGSNLTWDGICDALLPLIGRRPTRQSLSTHREIATAYKHRKQKLKTAEPQVPKPASLSIAAQRIKRLEAEVSDLKNTNALLLEQFLVIQYNAYKHGLKESQLTFPLPKIDRERTDQH